MTDHLKPAHALSRPQKLYVVCAAIFITALVLAEATSLKFFVAFDLPFTANILGEQFDQWIMTVGVIAFPITFIITDLLNEYFGKPGIRFVTFVGMMMIILEFLIIKVGIAVPVADISPISQEAFEGVFGFTGRVIFGSLVAYLLGQLADITLFHWLRGLTKGKHLWLRATGSTFGSQFIDTFVVLTITLWGQMSMQTILAITLFNYGYKFLIAVLITPIIYLAHWGIDRYLGHEMAEEMIHVAEEGGTVQV